MKVAPICCYCRACMTRAAFQNHCMHYTARLTACEMRWVYFREKYHNNPQKNLLTPVGEPLKFCLMGAMYFREIIYAQY